MQLHALPIIVIIYCSYWFAFNLGYYKNVKDMNYGADTMMPVFVGIGFVVAYYIVAAYFKMVGL